MADSNFKGCHLPVGLGSDRLNIAKRLHTAVQHYNANLTVLWYQERQQFELIGTKDANESQIAANLLQPRPNEGWILEITGQTVKGDMNLSFGVNGDLNYGFYDKGESDNEEKSVWGALGGVTDNERSFGFIKALIMGKYVLDIACGNGRTTARIASELEPRLLTALEPGVDRESPFHNAQEYPSDKGIQVWQLTAQDAAMQFCEEFDVVTVFKYNVGVLETEAFAASLARLINKDGVAIITSVEKARCYKGLEAVLYIIDALKRNFALVEVKQVDHSQGAREWSIICRKSM
jgi:2-polyprenyl-3-methyl-5-hydroxy-6-metoxy-1,4-benzoquinol methylase